MTLLQTVKSLRLSVSQAVKLCFKKSNWTLYMERMEDSYDSENFSLALKIQKWHRRDKEIF